MNTTDDALDTLYSRIQTAQKVIDLYIEELKKDVQTALYVACKQHIQSAAYLYVFKNAVECLTVHQQTVEELAEVVRRRVYSNAVTGYHHNSNGVDAYRKECESAAWGELMEILGDPITLEPKR